MAVARGGESDGVGAEQSAIATPGRNGLRSIAQADGDFDGDERSALAKVVNKELPQFEIKDIIALINECDETIAFDKRLGISEILDFIGGASGDDAELIMRICCFIGEADGTFDNDEKLVARDIAVRLNLSPSRYGL